MTNKEKFAEAAAILRLAVADLQRAAATLELVFILPDNESKRSAEHEAQPI